MFFEGIDNIQPEVLDTNEVMNTELAGNEGVYTNETDMAPSMEIQAEEISEVFLDTPELKFENWQQLSVDERASVLQNLESYVAQIEHRPEIPIVAEDLEDGVYGYFSPDDGMMHLSTQFLESNDYDSYVETMDTFFHEGRHAYQYSNISGNLVEQNKEYVEAWAKNFGDEWGYRSADIYGFNDYYLQPVEVDARAFATSVVSEIGLR